MNKLFAFSGKVSLGRLCFYPHCSHWLFQACSVCATAHVKSRAAIHQVEEDYGIYGTALKVTHPTPPPLQLTTRPLFLIYFLIVSQDFQFPVLPSFSDSNLLMVFCSKSLGQIHQFANYNGRGTVGYFCNLQNPPFFIFEL